MGQVSSALGQLRQVADVGEQELWKWREYLAKEAPDGVMLEDTFVRANQKLRGGNRSFWSELFHTLDSKRQSFVSTRRYLLLVAIMSDQCRNTTEEQLDWAFTLFTGDKEEVGLAEFSSIIATLNGCGDLFSAVTTHSPSSYATHAATAQREGSPKALGGIAGRRSSGGSSLGERKLKRSNATLQLPHVNGEVLFEKIDVNKDGRISRQEFLSHCSSYNDLVDLLSGLLNGLHVEGDCWEEKSLRRTATAFGLETFGAQVAGHGSEGPSPESMLQCDWNNQIWKPLAYNEFSFYEKLNSLSLEPGQKGELALELKEFCSAYYGRNFLLRNNDCWQYIVLEDLTAGFEAPCVIDLKMGRQGHGDDASLGKVLQQKILVQATTSSSLGFRVCGMRVYREGEKYLVKDKKWGAMSVKKSTMENVLRLFFGGAPGTTRRCVISAALERLHVILSWFERQFLFRFYSSSILIIYDAAARGVPNVRIAMVDFAHAHPIPEESQRDESYTFGLKNLIALLERLLSKNSSAEPPDVKPETVEPCNSSLLALTRDPTTPHLEVCLKS